MHVCCTERMSAGRGRRWAQFVQKCCLYLALQLFMQCICARVKAGGPSPNAVVFEGIQDVFLARGLPVVREPYGDKVRRSGQRMHFRVTDASRAEAKLRQVIQRNPTLIQRNVCIATNQGNCRNPG